MTSVRLEPAASWSRVEHYTTEPLRSLREQHVSTTVPDQTAPSTNYLVKTCINARISLFRLIELSELPSIDDAIFGKKTYFKRTLNDCLVYNIQVHV